MKILNITLLVGLMLSCINVAAVAPTKNQKKIETKTSKKPAKGWSLKAKVIAALGVVATGVVAYLAYQTCIVCDQSAHGPYDLYEDEPNQAQPLAAPIHQIQGPRARQLFYDLEANNQNFLNAFQNQQAQANILRLLNDPFLERYLEDVELAEIIRNQIQNQTDQPDFVQQAADANYVERFMRLFNEEALKSFN